MSISVTNSKDLVVNSISVINENKVIDLQELFLSNLYAINCIVGLSVATLNSRPKTIRSYKLRCYFFVF